MQGNGPSASQSYDLSGSNLTPAAGDITVSGSTNYEVSLSSASGFGSSLAVPYTGGALAVTPIYVRLKAGLSQNDYNGEIIGNAGGGAPTQNVTVSGSVMAPPTPGINAGSGTLTFATTQGIPSAQQSISVTGTVLSAPIEVAAPAGYELSTTSGNFTGATNTVQLPATGGDLYVRLNGTAIGTFNGSITFTSGANSASRLVEGTVTAAPMAPLLEYIFTAANAAGVSGNANVSGTAFTASSELSFTNGNNTPDFRRSNFPSATTVSNITTGYFEFVVAVGSGFQVDLASLTLLDRRSGTGPVNYELRTSADGFANSVGAQQTTGTAFGVTKTITLSGLSNIQGNLTVRIYAYGATGAGGTFAVDDVRLFGTVSAASANPFISGITPTSGPTGTVVTINGGNFSAMSVTGVAFGTTNAAFTLVNASQIIATVDAATPLGAQVVSLSDGTTTVSGPSFTVTAPPAPSFTATPTSLTFNTTVGQTATQSYVLTGSNLAASAMVSISSDNTAVEVSTDGGATYAATATATTTTTGTLNQAVQVRFTAPAAVGSTSATISNTLGAFSAPVSVTGNAMAVINNVAAGLLLLEDNFDYDAGTQLTMQGWAIAGTNATPAISTLADNNLSTTYPQGVALSATPATVSSRALLVPSGQDIFKAATRPAGSTLLYGAAIVNVSAAQNNGDYFMTLVEGGSTNYRNRVYVRLSGTSGFVFGLSVGSETVVYETTPTVFSFNTNYVVVVKSENSAATSGRDVASLFVLPVDTDLRLEPTTPLLTVSVAAAQANTLNSFVLRQGGTNSAATLTVDGVRLATGWGAVVGRPEFTEPAAVINAGNYYSIGVSGTNDQLTLGGPVVLEGSLSLDAGKIITTAASPLTLRPGVSTQVSASGTSFVSGPLVRESVNASLLFFPIGKRANYRPLTLNIATAPAGTTRYTAEQNEGAPADQVLLGDLKRVSRNRTYSVTPSPVPVAGTFAGTIELSFGTNDGVTDPAAASLVVAKSNGAGWENIGRSASTGTASGTGNVAGTLTSGTFKAFSDFALASTDADATANPLPVELVRFAAQRQTDIVRLEWATASEHNNVRFEVQRAADGAQFRTLTTVAGQGTTARPHTYSTIDRQPLPGTAYYRLRQVDTDGQVSFSPVVVVAAGKEVALYPNPASTELQLTAPAPEASYRVLSAIGAVMLQGKTNTGAATLNVAALPAGLYHLEVTTANGRVVRRFIRQE